MEAQYTPQYSRHVRPTAGSLGGRENGKISQVNLMSYRGVNFYEKLFPPILKLFFSQVVWLYVCNKYRRRPYVCKPELRKT